MQTPTPSAIDALISRIENLLEYSREVAREHRSYERRLMAMGRRDAYELALDHLRIAKQDLEAK